MKTFLFILAAILLASIAYAGLYNIGPGMDMGMSTGGGSGGAFVNYSLLLENGDYILLESGDKILLE